MLSYKSNNINIDQNNNKQLNKQQKLLWGENKTIFNGQCLIHILGKK